MPLTAFTLATGTSWTFSKTVTGFQPVSQGPDSKSFNLSSLVDLTTYTEALIATVTLTAAVTQDYNFNSFTDLLGTAVTATKALAIQVITSGPSSAICSLYAAPSNGLSWFLSGTAPKLNIPAGGSFIFSLQQGMTPQTVSAGAGTMRFENTGSGSLVVSIVVLVGP